MITAEHLKATFCGSVSVRKVPAGFAVGTPFELPSGDRVGFYVTRVGEGRWRLEDDGTTIPFLAASGVDLSAETRRRIFEDILQRCRVEYNEEEGELRTAPLPEDEIQAAATQFVTALIRLHDLEFLASHTVATAFREDVKRSLEKLLAASGARVEEHSSPYPELGDLRADLLVHFEQRTPIALFAATTYSHILEGALMRHKARHDLRKPLKVVAILQTPKPKSLPARALRLALNELDRTLVYSRKENLNIVETLREMTEAA